MQFYKRHNFTFYQRDRCELSQHLMPFSLDLTLYLRSFKMKPLFVFHFKYKPDSAIDSVDVSSTSFYMEKFQLKKLHDDNKQQSDIFTPAIWDMGCVYNLHVVLNWFYNFAIKVL